MNASSTTMELSVAYLGWINDQLRVDIESDQQFVRRTKNSAVRRFVVAGVACISLALAQIISS